jgi:hypothetical protein
MGVRTFQAKAPLIMRRLMRAFALDKIDAAAIMGNLGHESNGLSTLQEVRPTVAGSRGGYGWAQWTGPRRKAFEAWCRANKLAPSSDAANLGFLIFELSTEYRSAVSAVRSAVTLEDKVRAFEAVYERAGIKHYSSREHWARLALEAFGVSPDANPKPMRKSRTAAGGIAAGTAAGGVIIQSASEVKDAASTAAEHGNAGTWIGVALGLVILIAACVVVYARWDDAGRPVPKWLGGAA